MEDSLIGPATISELRKTIAICTQTHQTGLEIVSNGCYTDGATIYISAPPTDLTLLERWMLLEAATIHESWHILFQSDFQLLRSFIEKYESKYKRKIPYISQITHDIVNIVEDARIEYLGKKRFLGTQGAIHFNNAYWLQKRPSFQGMKDWQMLMEGLLQLGVCEGIKEPIPDEKVKCVLRAANFYLQWAKIHENSKASFRAAEKIMELLLTYFTIEGSWKQQILSPPKSIQFQPKTNQEDNSTQDLPDLPEDLQKDLESLQKVPQTPDKEKETDEGENAKKELTKKTDLNSSDTETEDSKSGSSAALESNRDEIESESISEQNTENNVGQEGNRTSIDRASDLQKQSLEQKKAPNSASSESEGILQDSTPKQAEKLQPSIPQQAEDSQIAPHEGYRSNGKTVSETNNHTDSNSNPNGTPEIRIVTITELDPFQSGKINPADIRIKVEDLVKRNYELHKDKTLEEEARDVIQQIKRKKRYKEVFHTQTFDIGVVCDLASTSSAVRNFEQVYNSIRPLIHVTINQFKSLFTSGRKTTSKLKFGRLDSKRMVRGLINEDPYIFKKNLVEKGKDEIAIALLIDQSGSMYGKKIANAQKAAILFGEVLNSLELTFAIYGWTDIMYSEYYPLKSYRKAPISLTSWKSITFPPSINQEIFTLFCYKEFDEKYSECKYKLGLISALCDNSDHNAIEYLAKKLQRTKKRVKILLVLSDGQPVAISYQYIAARLRASGKKYRKRYDLGNIGINVTRQAIETARKSGVQVLCVSIDKVKNYQEQIYGANNYILIEPQRIQELPVRVAKVLSLLLRQAGIKPR
ncbi:MAG: cobaltochelatase CobT-related protein [Candidatus Helarchaeota archaeon]